MLSYNLLHLRGSFKAYMPVLLLVQGGVRLGDEERKQQAVEIEEILHVL